MNNKKSHKAKSLCGFNITKTSGLRLYDDIYKLISQHLDAQYSKICIDKLFLSAIIEISYRYGSLHSNYL
jgi:hypothetical protein